MPQLSTTPASRSSRDWNADECFDRYARLVRRILGVPVALVSIVEEDRQVFPGASGLPASLDAVRQTPLSQSLCSIVVRERQPLVAPDLRRGALADHGAVTELGFGAYLGWPLVDQSGTPVGSLCALDFEAREWSQDDLDTLRDLAACCSTELHQQALRREAAEEAERARHGTQRGQVLLLLSEALAGATSLAQTAAAIQEVGVTVLHCSRVAMFLPRSLIHPGEDADGADGDGLVFVPTAGVEWPAASSAPVIATAADNPIADCWRRRALVLLGSRAEQDRRYPGTPSQASTGEARAAAPLGRADQCLGVLAMVWDDAREFGPENTATLTALTAYTAEAVERVVLLDGRARASETLQRAMLTELPRPDHLDLSARYLPAVALENVGGDWYDAFTMGSGATAVMVGDVVGHDIRAAADMSQLRNILRGLAWATDDLPSEVVGRLDQSLPDLGVEALATLVFARIEQSGAAPEPGAHVLQWTNAGHPPPLLITGGDTRWLDGAPADLMLGVQPDSPRLDQGLTMPPGSTVLMFTDGLVERRGEDLDAGLDRLAASAARHGRGSVDDLLDGILADLVDGPLGDDVAMLAIRLRPPVAHPNGYP